jgi:hypothetical protein
LAPAWWPSTTLAATRVAASLQHLTPSDIVDVYGEYVGCDRLPTAVLQKFWPGAQRQPRDDSACKWLTGAYKLMVHSEGSGQPDACPEYRAWPPPDLSVLIPQGTTPCGSASSSMPCRHVLGQCAATLCGPHRACGSARCRAGGGRLQTGSKW